MSFNPANEWNEALSEHPIFSLPKSFSGPLADARDSLELSTNTLPRFVKVDPTDDGPAPSGRRQTVILKDADLIVAAGREIRMTTLGDAKGGQTTRKTYKALHTPNVQFSIHQISLNPNGKLLAVAGAFQVAVIVLPRPGFTRLVPETIDCKSVQVGQFYHASGNSAPIAKIEWHPWGEAASTLLVMTVDGRLREYDISVDTEEPQQVLSFVQERKSKSYMAEDASEREVASFALGKGRADWGPLTVYALMKSGDIFAICPYLPKNASVPSSYIHSLECFISAKQELLSQGASKASPTLNAIYDYQQKYVSALLRELPSGTVFPATSRVVSLHPPTNIKSSPIRQGPFLLQPEPRVLEGSDGGDATDIAYLVFGTDDDDDDDDEREGNPTEHLGIVTVVYQDGKVDLYLDVEKVEACWDTTHELISDLPMLAVYETIDLGIFSTISSMTDSCVDLLQANHPVLLLDPIYDDILYVYHAFGVHALQIGPVLRHLGIALRGADDEAALTGALQNPVETLVQPLLTTFSVEQKASNPIIGVTLPNDVYLSYSILILSSAMRISVFPLTLRSETVHESNADTALAILAEAAPPEKSKWLTPVEGLPPPFVSTLARDPFEIPPILTGNSLPTVPRHSLPASVASKEILLTPDVLTYLLRVIDHLSSQVRDIKIAYTTVKSRNQLQENEMQHHVGIAGILTQKAENLKGERKSSMDARIEKMQMTQKQLLARLDRLLAALMRQASPELSEHEVKWFEELKRMKQEVLGSGRYDANSLVAKTKQLENEYARVTPALKSILEKEKLRKDKLTEVNGSLGFSQAFNFGQQSTAEQTKIQKLEKSISKLASQLNITLGKMPHSE